MSVSGVGNNFNFTTNALHDDNFRGSAIGTEVCTIADGDPNMDLEAMLRFAPEGGISTEYLLTGQRKRAEPFQSVLLNQQEPVVQPSGTYNLVSTSAFGIGEPSFENLESGQGNIPGYKKRFAQLQSRPGPNEMIPKDSGGQLRGVDVYDYDFKDPVSGKAPKRETNLGSEVEMQQKVNEALQAYQRENDLNAKTLPFQASNWAATHPELVNDMDGNIPVYSPDGNVISNIKTNMDKISIPLPDLEETQARLQAKAQEQAQAQAQARARQQAREQALAKERELKEHEKRVQEINRAKLANKKKNQIGFILLIVAGIIVLGILITVIIFSSRGVRGEKRGREEFGKERGGIEERGEQFQGGKGLEFEEPSTSFNPSQIIASSSGYYF